MFLMSNYFNPRSHEGSDQHLQCRCRMGEISIHAPTRGATVWYTLEDLAEAISIHAPTRGATDVNAMESAIIIDFNPRSHEGSDFCPFSFGFLFCISIHAPTRGATEIYGGEEIFNKFQSTLPRGERPSFRPRQPLHRSDFNPRSHEGSDPQQVFISARQRYFNPRSHEGSDYDASYAWRYVGAFQSTLPRGERLKVR